MIFTLFLIRLAHLLASAALFGAMFYSFTLVHPRARKFFANPADFEKFITLHPQRRTLESGRRICADRIHRNRVGASQPGKRWSTVTRDSADQVTDSDSCNRVLLLCLLEALAAAHFRHARGSAALSAAVSMGGAGHD